MSKKWEVIDKKSGGDVVGTVASGGMNLLGDLIFGTSSTKTTTTVKHTETGEIKEVVTRGNSKVGDKISDGDFK